MKSVGAKLYEKIIKNVNDVIHSIKICICRQAKALEKYYVSLKLEKVSIISKKKCLH